MSANNEDDTNAQTRIVQEVYIMKLVPLEDRVVLKQLEAETTTASGIVIPGADKEKPQQAEVLAVGPGKTTDDGKLLPMNVKVGDKVVFSKYSGTEVKLSDKEDDKVTIVRQSDILAIIED